MSEYEPRTGPLAAANVAFHETYERLVRKQTAELGHAIAVIVMLADDLVLLVDGRRETQRVIPEAYHRLKAYGHLVFGVQIALMDHGSGPLLDDTRAAVSQRLVEIDAAMSDTATLPADERDLHRSMLTRLRTLLDTVRARGEVDGRTLRAHAAEAVPLITRGIAGAVRLELDRMHAVVTGWRTGLGPDRWNELLVVLCGRHQPRYREASRQYFGRLLGEAQGDGALLEQRIVYGEGLASVGEALDLLARHLVDQEASALIFGNRRHLQQDLMADVTAAYLDELLPAQR